MVEAGVSQEELKQILTQLRAMGRSTAPPQAPPQPPYTSSSPAVFPPNHGISAPVPHTSAVPQLPPQYGYPQPTSSGATGAYVTPAVQLAQGKASPSSTPDPSTGAPKFSGINDLFKSLMKAGLVNSGNTSVGAGSSGTDTVATPTETPEMIRAKEEKLLEEQKLQAQKMYAKRMLSMKIRLSTSDISRYVQVVTVSNF